MPHSAGWLAGSEGLGGCTMEAWSISGAVASGEEGKEARETVHQEEEEESEQCHWGLEWMTRRVRDMSALPRNPS